MNYCQVTTNQRALCDEPRDVIGVCDWTTSCRVLHVTQSHIRFVGNHKIIEQQELSNC